MAKEPFSEAPPKVDPFGVGMLDDGTLLIHTPEEASKLVAERDKEEAEDLDVEELREEDFADLEGDEDDAA